MDKFTRALNESRDMRGLMAQFGYYRPSDVDTIQKGHLSNLFRHGAEERGFVVDKKGKDIKDKIREILNRIQVDIAAYKSVLASLEHAIGTAPSKPAKERYSYVLEGFEDVVKDLPPCYEIDYSACYPEEVGTRGASLMSGTESDEVKSCKEKCAKMEEYNNKVYMIVQNEVDRAMCNTMIANFKDDSIYHLTVKEASILGW